METSLETLDAEQQPAAEPQFLELHHHRILTPRLITNDDQYVRKACSRVC